MNPFLKWAGGKRWMTSAGLLPRPDSFQRYFEPFLGGGAVFFYLRPQRSVLSDINEELIELYRVIRDNPMELTGAMEQHQQRHCFTYYYETRGCLPIGRIERAARTLYLNRTCWNGLYRVNLRGEFNVPIGTKSTVIFEDEDFGMISERLQGADLEACDFESAISRSVAGDFIFIDPPYTVQHNYNGFLKYNETIFSWADQLRLREAVSCAIRRGVAVAITNADHPSVHSLYRGICSYEQLTRSSVISGDARHRGATTEALFFANL